MTDKNVNPDDDQADENRDDNVDERFADIVGDVDIDADQLATDSPAPEELSRESQLEALLAERTEDLQRLQAEYVNYKRRVDRDRALSRQSGVDKVITDLMPVLDSIAMARNHGLTSFGEVGDVFDPNLHEALMQMPMEGVSVTSVSQVMQPGYKLGDRVLRPARVAVSDPDPNATSADESSQADGESAQADEDDE